MGPEGFHPKTAKILFFRWIFFGNPVKYEGFFKKSIQKTLVSRFLDGTRRVPSENCKNNIFSTDFFRERYKMQGIFYTALYLWMLAPALLSLDGANRDFKEISGNASEKH